MERVRQWRAKTPGYAHRKKRGRRRYKISLQLKGLRRSRLRRWEVAAQAISPRRSPKISLPAARQRRRYKISPSFKILSSWGLSPCSRGAVTRELSSFDPSSRRAGAAHDGFRPRRLLFADIPLLGTRGPIGSALGGTGVAVSAYSRHAAEAVRFAYWVASAEVQKGPYAAAGGQPGHALAWADAEVNRAANDFYAATRATLDGAWLRPRYDGYMDLQHAASLRLNQGLQARETGRTIIAGLNALFAGSRRDRRGASADGRRGASADSNPVEKPRKSANRGAQT